MRISGHRVGIGPSIGFLVILLAIWAAVAGPMLAPYGPNDIVGDVWGPASAQHWLGFDNLGRDMASRMLYAARTTISLVIVTTCCTFVIGVIAGLAASVIGGWLDIVLLRVVDIIMAVPQLILALIVLSVLGTSIPVLIGTIAILDSTRVFRLTRAVAMNITVLDYVEVARLRGEGLWWVMRREILPNSLPPLVAEFGMRFCFTLLFIAALSFLGLGIQPPATDWGSMVRENALAINFGLAAPLIPAAAIAVVTIGVNLVVDWFLSIHGRAHGEEL
ncbi:MAG TPA: ABC transporter permease [Acetobacteraceae bacterium]|nr:ABC transporter permease [Acetobacteraceae bacterium]